MSLDNLSTNIIQSENNDIKSENNDINKNIYRYKFTDDFTSELFMFSKIHQYDHRKDFKEAWEIWMEENDEIVNDEVRRLTNLGYDGDITDKMFKSASTSHQQNRFFEIFRYFIYNFQIKSKTRSITVY